MVCMLVLAAAPVAPKQGKVSDSAAFGLKINGPLRPTETADANARLPLSLFNRDEDGEEDAPEDSATLKGKKYGDGGFNPGHHSPPCDDASVPEPASFAFLGAGMIGLALLRRKRRHS